MTDELATERSREVEAYAELGVLPKLGVKFRLAQRSRLNRVIDSAAGHAELGRDQLEDRLLDSDDQVRDVVVTAALRAGEVDDEDYIDVLGRLIAGALDTANIDELAFVTSEITKLEPIHLRALLGFFYFGRAGAENAEPNLSPADAAWASNRYRTDREVASLLKMTRETSSQVLLRLDRDGFIHLHSGPASDGEATSGPRDWAGRVLSMLFPSIEVEFRNTIDGSGVGGESTDVVDSMRALVAIPNEARSPRDHRAISELEAEIKKVERLRNVPLGGIEVFGRDDRWLATMKRRLRKVDPDNPWAYDD